MIKDVCLELSSVACTRETCIFRILYLLHVGPASIIAMTSTGASFSTTPPHPQDFHENRSRVILPKSVL